MSPAPPPSGFCWLDYETFGTSPAWDRPAQFAAIRTDAELNVVGEPVVLWCRQSEDYLPQPGACRVTGLTPEETNRRGVPEAEFMDAVIDTIAVPGSCSAGYNSVRFDDEFTRHALFRNLADPYAHEWRDNASRWDLLDVVRLTRALRPDGIEWPTLADGRASNRLEHLAAANGIDEGAAHDALVDVRVTIALARLIRARQPRLFAHALAHRGKASLAPVLDPARRTPRLLVSAAIPATRHHLALVVPVARHPDNPNAVIVFDLAHEPAALDGLSSEEIAARVFARGVPAEDPSRLGLHAVALNRCPALAPLEALRDADAERLGIARDVQLGRVPALEARIGADLPERLRRAFARRREPGGETDVDASLYAGGFLSRGDRDRLERLRASERPPEADGFEDPRLPEMVFRFRARNRPDTLDDEELARWRAHVARRLGAGADAPWLSLDGFERAMAEQDWRPEEAALRASLERYAERVAGAFRCRAASRRP